MKINSSAITDIKYSRQGLTLRFSTGKVYRYPTVPRSLRDKLVRAESKGKFFNKEIRPKYEGVELWNF